MKLSRKIIALLLVISLMFVFGACQPGTETTVTQNTAGSETSAAAVKVPAEKVKIGFVTFTTGAEQYRGIKKYFEYLSQNLNIEFIYSEAIGSAEKELNFIESCASAGCIGIIGYYNVARATSIQLAIDKGMYYYGVAEENDVYNAFLNNDHYLGGNYGGNAEYECGYEMGKALVDAGCKRLVYASGGADMGVQLFIDRQKGFKDALAEATAAGKDVQLVYDVKGWPNTPPYISEQTAALGIEGVDGVASSFGIATWLQPINDLGLADKIKLSSNDSLSETLVAPFAEGRMAGVSIEQTSVHGIAIAIMINAYQGNLDITRNEEGNAPRIPLARWVATSNDEYQAYYNIETDGTWAVNAADVLSLIKSYDSTATYQKMIDLIIHISIDDIKARRAIQTNP